MNLNISVVNYDEALSTESIKEELRDVNEKIILTEKKLLNANRNLTFVYSSDKVSSNTDNIGYI